MRREIVDYVTGKIEVADFVREAAVAERAGRALKSIRIPAAAEGGWRGKLTRATADQLQAIAADARPPEDKAKALAAETGLGLKEAKALVEAVPGDPGAVRKRIAAVEAGVADIHQGVGAGTFRLLFA